MDQHVRDLMTPNPSAVSAEASVLDAARMMREKDIGDVVVRAQPTLRHPHRSRHRRACARQAGPASRP
jgi:hypothetical protein